MAESLVKTVRYDLRPGSPGVPSSPGSPAVPPWSYTVYDTVLVPIYATRPNPNNSSFSLNVVVGYRQTLVARVINVPGQPAVPPTLGTPATPASETAQYNFGWNAGGRSTPTMTGDGAYTFFVAGSGVVTGFCPVGANVATQVLLGAASVRYGVYFSHGTLRVVSNGVIVYTHPAGVDLIDQIRLERRAGAFNTYLSGALIHTTAAAGGAMTLLASLYAGGDMVYSAESLDLASGVSAGDLQAIQGICGDGVPASTGYGALRALLGGGGDVLESVVLIGPFTYSDVLYRPAQHGGGALAPIVGLAAQDAYSFGSGEIAPIDGVSLAGAPMYAPTLPARCAGTLCQLSGQAFGTAVGTGSAAGALQPLTGLSSDHAIGMGGGELLPLDGFSNAYEGPAGGFLLSNVFAYPVLDAQLAMLATMNSSGQVTGILTVQRIREAAINSTVIADLVFAVASIINGALQSTIVAADATPNAAEGIAWAVNNEGAQPPSMYENFAFNSFFNLGTRYFGVREDGLYELTGATDAGDAIEAMLGFGERSFGTSKLKRLENVYVGISSTGALLLRVTVNGQAFTYVARAYDADMMAQRFDTGLGLRANYYTTELYNQEGADFELDTVQFRLVELSRRI